MGRARAGAGAGRRCTYSTIPAYYYLDIIHKETRVAGTGVRGWCPSLFVLFCWTRATRVLLFTYLLACMYTKLSTSM